MKSTLLRIQVGALPSGSPVVALFHVQTLKSMNLVTNHVLSHPTLGLHGSLLREIQQGLLRALLRAPPHLFLQHLLPLSAWVENLVRVSLCDFL